MTDGGGKNGRPLSENKSHLTIGHSKVLVHRLEEDAIDRGTNG